MFSCALWYLNRIISEDTVQALRGERHSWVRMLSFHGCLNYIKMSLKQHQAFLCQDFSALKSKVRKRKSKVSYKLRQRLYNLQHDFKPCGKLSGDSMTACHLGHDSSTLITPPLHGRQICAMLSICALVFLIFPFSCILATQGKACFFPFPSLSLLYKLSFLCSESRYATTY